MSNFLNDLASMYNLETNKTQAWGTVDGYWFQFAMPSPGENSLKVRTAVQFSDEAAANNMGSFLGKLSREDPSFGYTRSGGNFLLSKRKPFGGFKAQDVANLLMKVTVAFRGAGARPTCFQCGENNAEGFAMVNGTALKLCSKCQAGLEQTVMQQKEEYAAVQRNYLKGILGAIIGALVGSIAWILIGVLGYLAAIGGMAISFCAMKGYTLMKGKVTKLAVLIICLVSIAVMVLAQFLTLDIVFANEMAKAGNPIDFGLVLQHTFELPFIDSKTQSYFIRDCGLGLLFLAMGCYFVLKPYFARAKAPTDTFQKL